MEYDVKIAARAERDLEQIYSRIHADESEAAHQWYRALSRAILSLKASPLRCPITPESPRLRHLLHGRKPHVYRVIFRVVERERIVEVLHIRHGARSEFTGP
jgi:plasmid stabilization system protein ParE